MSLVSRREDEPGGEERVRGKACVLVSPASREEERVDPPDERRRQRVQQKQDKIDALNALGASVQDAVTTPPAAMPNAIEATAMAVNRGARVRLLSAERRSAGMKRMVRRRSNSGARGGLVACGKFAQKRMQERRTAPRGPQPTLSAALATCGVKRFAKHRSARPSWLFSQIVAFQ